MSMKRFGKHPPKQDYRTLRLKNYLKDGLAAPPAAYDVLAQVYGKLSVNDPAELFPMDGNDSIGDCTIAALAHASTIYHGLVGKKSIAKTAALEKIYYHLTGGVDSGLNELDVLNYWRKSAAAAEKILGFVAIDPKNHLHIKQAIQIFGGVYLGFQVQQNAIQDFDAHKTWTPGKLTNDGHAVYAASYDDKTVTVLTWGSTQKANWAWWDECVDEAYAILPAEAKAQNFDGIKFDELKNDLNAVAS
ncbi:MAG TPA: hypothetical protein VHV51_25910 [Polyangiaceae bacterium]|jgi:hypothetical protein|nr:hypothetical protein [Polyangiaceae bacterium]